MQEPRHRRWDVSDNAHLLTSSILLMTLISLARATTYYYVSSKLFYYQAKLHCRKMGMNITSIATDAQFVDVRKFLAEKRLMSNVWINPTKQMAQKERIPPKCHEQNGTKCCTVLDRISKKFLSDSCHQELSFLCEGEVCIDDSRGRRHVTTVPERNWFRHKESIQYQCAEGYIKVNGTFTRTCLTNGTISGQVPKCKAITCKIQKLEGATLLHPLTPTVPLGDVAVYSCNKTHNHKSGSLRRICSPTGDWIGERLSCVQNNMTSLYNQSRDIEEIQRELKIMKKSLTTNKRNTSKYRRSKESFMEYQTSHVTLGLVFGVSVLLTGFVLIVISDIPLLFRHIQNGAYPTKKRQTIK